MSESEIRLLVFALSLAGFAVLERRWSAFAAPAAQPQRLGTNALLGLLGALVTRLAAPVGVAAAAVWGSQRQIGLMHQFPVGSTLAGCLAMVTLDMAVYWQHRLMHRVPLLWRLHAVHHADPHIDVTTAIRFHPIEIGLSLLVKSAVVLLVGAPVWAVLVFESWLSTMALFNHANLRLTAAQERALRIALITPALHRVHHAEDTPLQNRNFGFSVTLWDRLFRSYLPPERAPRPIEKFGLAGTSDAAARSLVPMLLCQASQRD